MLREAKLLSVLELRNLFGINSLLHTKDKGKKRTAALLSVAWVIVILMVFFYVGGLVWGLVTLGIGEIVGAYLVTIASIVILAFGILKAGGEIFHQNGYDILCALPIRQSAIVVSRFVRMYVEDLVLTLAVLVPGGAVYAFLTRPGLWFYPVWVISALLIPLLPLSLSVLFGAVVTAAASRMKNKALAESVLSVGIVLVVLLGTSQLGAAAPEITPEMLKDMAGIVTELLEKLYPPAVWLGSTMIGSGFTGLLLFVGASAAVFAAVVALTAKNFHAVCRRLNVTTAKHDYRMEQLETGSLLSALYRREFKRYFASGVYVTNTIMGPVMGVLLTGALFFVGADTLGGMMGLPIDLLTLMPFFLGGTFGMMPPTAVSVSMEGKNWWIIKTLPLTAKDVFDAKILLSLSLMAPSYLLAEVFLLLALKPVGLDLLWMLLIPMVIILFACVGGISANLLLPRFDWDNEVTIVKQSASAALGGFAGMLVAIAGGIATSVVPGHLSRMVFCVVTLGVTAALYLRNNRTDLRTL